MVVDEHHTISEEGKCSSLVQKVFALLLKEPLDMLQPHKETVKRQNKGIKCI